ncbi:MAG: hypothetical protein A3K67_02180 [Euryarchaeota archaeon RBG_16_62_10]|nr:MAG: hypothetical protein A3K67_02180 [Euryarchaeota archaeon RBG_16_62_10]
MPGGRYLKDRIGLYLLFSAAILTFSVAVLVLPYETVYVESRDGLMLFLAVMIACVFVFLLGTMYNMLIWMQGKGLVGAPERRLLRAMSVALKVVVSRRFWKALGVFAKDGLYLSKLKGRSRLRWFMHLLILGGFALMFVLDLVVTFSLDILRYGPMIDEDGWAKMWVRDFAFDLAGLMMLVGLSIAAVRRFVFRPKIVRTELPDAVSVVFLLLIVLGGFVLEGMGLAAHMEDHTVNHEYSFVGYLFSLATPPSVSEFYDEFWLVHGVMSALFIAYIPFSKLFHMIATPIAIEVDGLVSKEVSGA